ncbi:50S ribosomal protein L22 [Patescibacteria group bacterium]|nr:50S ribosomal protein L22 [Patescibacteria group bacterium]
MKVKAILRKYQCSPKKVRLVADKIRGLKVTEAETALMFINKKSAEPMLKLLRSGIANAENNYHIDKNDLVIKEIRVDSDGMYKRYTPKARGMATPILKKLSRVELTLEGEAKIEEDVKITKIEDKKVEKVAKPRTKKVNKQAKK